MDTTVVPGDFAYIKVIDNFPSAGSSQMEEALLK
jgi:hypothetical protein